MSQVKPTRSETTNIAPRRGQAFAEFALTLPILLLLVFGIIEFARLFQTWVVLQSAARAGARAASIGMINYEIFNVPIDAQPIDLRVMNAVVPCLEEDERGVIQTHASGVKYYDGTEGLFATMYDGTDCDPSNEDHTQYRKDILRVFTVISEVRETASTIAVYNDRVDQDHDSITPQQAFDFFKGYWNSPYKSIENSNSPGWLSVEICSTRPLMNGIPSSNVETRFATIRNSQDVSYAGGNEHNYPVPLCKLNEIPALGNGLQVRPDALDNHGYRWFDVGGPGDRITVFIKFNHPLITPLNLAQYIHLESRRSSVNESFRAPKAVGAFQRSIPPGRDPDEQGPQPTATDPSTATNTDTPSSTWTRTHTPTLSPFSCNNITVDWASNPFSGTSLNLMVRNGNHEQTELSRARITWNAHVNWQLMYAQQMSLADSPHWWGDPPSSTPQTVADSQLHGRDIPSYRVIGGGATEKWSTLFVNGPANLFTAFRLNDFDVELIFLDPLGNPCSVILVQEEQPTPTASNTPTAGTPPSPTPVCGSLNNIRPPSFQGYDSFNGSVYFEIENIGQQPVYLLGFELVWPDPDHPQVRDHADPGDYYLRRVVVGGTNTDDAQAVEVWTSSGVGQDAVGNKKTTIPYDIATRSSGPEGSWLTAAVLQPGITRIWLDFDGFGGSLRQFEVLPHHFNGSRFFVGHIQGCREGLGNPTLPPTAVIQATLPSPAPTNTPRPTDPPRPTNTRTPITPTLTPSRTNTKAPSNTPKPATNTLPAPSRTPIGALTSTPGAGGEG